MTKRKESALRKRLAKVGVWVDPDKPIPPIDREQEVHSYFAGHTLDGPKLEWYRPYSIVDMMKDRPFPWCRSRCPRPGRYPATSRKKQSRNALLRWYRLQEHARQEIFRFLSPEIFEPNQQRALKPTQEYDA